MTGAVKKSGVPPIAQLGGITLIGEKLFHLLVQFQAIDSGPHLFQRKRLPLIDRLPEPPLFIAGPAAQHGSR